MKRRGSEDKQYCYRSHMSADSSVDIGFVLPRRSRGLCALCKIRRKSSCRAPPTLRQPLSPHLFPPFALYTSSGHFSEHTHLSPPIHPHRSSQSRRNPIADSRRPLCAKMAQPDISSILAALGKLSAHILLLLRGKNASDSFAKLNRTRPALPLP